MIQSDPSHSIDVIVSNPDAFHRKLNKLIQSGISNLQIVADFDRTLSKYRADNGEISYVSYGVLSNTGVLSDSLREQCDQLFEKYYPIEKDMTLTDFEKIPKMQAWWSEVNTLLLQEGITQPIIERCVQCSKLHLRAGVPELFQLVRQHSIPVIILSAGLGDVIECVLEKQQLLSSTVVVVSNFMTFEPSSGVATGFKGSIIHTFNKSQQVAEQQLNGRSQTFKRSNVLLLGDSLSDIRMIDESRYQVSLKVGFLNSNEAALLPQYKAIYDIVLVNDTSMEFVNSILLKVISGKGR